MSLRQPSGARVRVGEIYFVHSPTHTPYDISSQYLMFVNCSFVLFFTILLSKCFHSQEGRDGKDIVIWH